MGTNILTLDNHGKYGDPHSQYLNAYKFIPVGYISGATNPELKPVKIGTISFRKEQYEETDDSYDYRIFLMFHIFSDPNGLTNNGALNDIYTINFTATSDGSNIRDISIENLTNHTFYGRCIVDLVTYTSSVVRADIYLRLDVNKPCYVSVIKNGVYLTDYMEDTRSDMAQFFPYLTDTPSNLTVLDTFVHPYYEKASQHSYFVFDTGKTPVSTKINSFGSNAVLKIFSCNLPYYNRMNLELDMEASANTNKLSLYVYANSDGTMSITGKNNKVLGTMDFYYTYDSSGNFTLYTMAGTSLDYILHLRSYYSTNNVSSWLQTIDGNILANQIYDRTTLTNLVTIA